MLMIKWFTLLILSKHINAKPFSLWFISSRLLEMISNRSLHLIIIIITIKLAYLFDQTNLMKYELSRPFSFVWKHIIKIGCNVETASNYLFIIKLYIFTLTIILLSILHADIYRFVFSHFFFCQISIYSICCSLSSYF